MRIFLSFLALSLLLVLASCAPKSQRPHIDPNLQAEEAQRQRDMAVRGFWRQSRRLEDVAGPILFRNADLCSETDRTVNSLGISTGALEDTEKEWRPAYGRVLGMDQGVTVLSVMADSPAAAAKLPEGGRVKTLEGAPVPQGKEGHKAFLAGLDKAVQAGGPVRLTVEHQGETEEYTLTPAKRCAPPVKLQVADTVNAYADGKQIIVTTGMMRFCDDDAQLALIIGHELAHDTMGHLQAQTGNRIIGGILDGAFALLTGVYAGIFTNAAHMAYSQEFEAEADYVGLYYMARAGYELEGAPDIWRRMAMIKGENISEGTTHPATAARFVALEAAIKEIEAKQAAGQELRPEMQGD